MAKSDIKSFFKNGYDPEKKNSAALDPPKPGEIMICRVCGKEMPPESFSKDEYKRKKEFKWHTHWDCMQQKFDECDRSTPGLLSERNRK